MTDRDRETLEEFLETGFHISVPMAGGKCDVTPDHEVVFAAIRSLLERLEAAEQNYATVYESAERAEQLWMEVQLERDEARREIERLRADLEWQGAVTKEYQALSDERRDRIQAALAKASRIIESLEPDDIEIDHLESVVKALKGKGE